MTDLFFGGKFITMPKKSRPKSSPVRKDFLYYLPLITAIVVNLFWGMFGVVVALFSFFQAAAAEMYNLPKIWVYGPLIPLALLPLFPLSLILVVISYKSCKLQKHFLAVEIFYLVTLPLARYFERLATPGFFFGGEVKGLSYFSFVRDLWFLSAIITTVSLIAQLKRKAG